MNINSISANNYNRQNFNGKLMVPMEYGKKIIDINDIKCITDDFYHDYTYITTKQGKRFMTGVPIATVLAVYTAACQKPDVTIKVGCPLEE